MRFYIIASFTIMIECIAQNTRAHELTFELDSHGKSDVAPLLEKYLLERSKTLRLPCGIYKVSNAVALPSDSEIEGAGPCTVIKMSPDMRPSELHAKNIPGGSKGLRAVFTNRTVGTSNIIIRSLTIDGSDSPGNAHLISFYKASNIKIEAVHLMGSGDAKTQDGISMIASSNYTLQENSCIKVSNACYDQWDGSSHFKILDNKVDGKGQLTYGILINGISTAYVQASTSDFIIAGNEILNVKAIGIGAYGLCAPDKSVCGTVTNGTVSKNKIENVTQYHGIWVGNASGLRIEDNLIIAAATDAIRVAAENKGGITQNIFVNRNTIDRGSTRGAQAISVGTGTDFIKDLQITQNTIRGYPLDMMIRSGTVISK